jgi:23S rRNA U2552 (ribose-2'-O)-methylase RlmE/FtsJ
MASAIKAPPWQIIQFQKNKIDASSITSFFGIVYGNWAYDSPKEDEKYLYELRDKIEKYEDVSGATKGVWEYYKKMVNPYELVYTQPKYSDYPKSVCMLNPLSRSYFKIIEILNVSRFFEEQAGGTRLRSAHVCEGPGGFIEGFFDECERRRIIPLSATAMTLRPHQANVPGWKRASNFLQKHKSVQILYGADNTGNILNYENQEAFIAACQKVALFTGDGGFDFSTDYATQEEAVFPLLIASTRIGFECMRLGASFVLKFFDIHHAATTDLLVFLALHFRTWTLYKPATSRPCNPEHYFIGVDYKGCGGENLEMLRAWSMAVHEDKKLQRLIRAECSPPAEIAHALEEIRAKAVHQQIENLTNVFALIDSGATIISKSTAAVHEVMSYDWCKTFNAPVRPDRVLLIEASRTCLQAAGLL